MSSPTIDGAAWIKWRKGDKKPALHEEVLVFSPENGIFTAQIITREWVRSSSGRYTPVDDFYGDGDLGITHWMPKPSAPVIETHQEERK